MLDLPITIATNTMPLAIKPLVRDVWVLDTAPAMDETAWGFLENQIQEIVLRFPGKMSVVITDLKTGRTLSINGDNTFYPACLIKLPTLMAGYAASQKGILDLRKTVTLRSQDIVDGSGIMRRDPVGSQYSLREVLRLMIIYSDNVALNKIYDELGPDTLNSLFQELGLRNTTLSHKLMFYGNLTREKLSALNIDDSDALFQELVSNHIIQPSGNLDETFITLKNGSDLMLSSRFTNIQDSVYSLLRQQLPSTGYNRTTANDMANLLRIIYEQEGIYGYSAAKALSILKDNRLNDRLPAGLPPDTVVAHKTGSTETVCHDSGIIYGPKTDLVVCVLTEEPRGTYNMARDAIREVARKAWDYGTRKILIPYGYRAL